MFMSLTSRYPNGINWIAFASESLKWLGQCFEKQGGLGLVTRNAVVGSRLEQP